MNQAEKISQVNTAEKISNSPLQNETEKRANALGKKDAKITKLSHA